MKNVISGITVCASIAGATGCSLSGSAGHECLDPQTRIAELHRKASQNEITRTQFNGALHRLAVNCPRNASVLMAAAEASYEESNFLAAQQYLDELLSLSKRYPAAALLRAKIALKEGNYRYARRFIEGEIKLSPDQGVLREVLAAVLYLQGDYSASRHAIEASIQLGAPAWRASYHLGLIEEALGNFNEAAVFYTRAVELKPDWNTARSRLAGLLSIYNVPYRP